MTQRDMLSLEDIAVTGIATPEEVKVLAARLMQERRWQINLRTAFENATRELENIKKGRVCYAMHGTDSEIQQLREDSAALKAFQAAMRTFVNYGLPDERVVECPSSHSCSYCRSND